MRKIASLAALTLCVAAGGASAASADVSIGPLAPSTTAAPDAGTLGFANGWCGAPWQWSGPQSGTDCAAQHGGGAAGQ